MISICVPSRKRSGAFRSMCESALDQAYDKNNIEFVVFRDADDSVQYNYLNNTIEVIGKRTEKVFQMWNECQKKATGPIYMFMADDFIFDSTKWDKEVIDEFEKYEDKIVLLSVDNGDLWIKYGFSGLGFLHKNWIDAVGYLFPNYFYPNCADKWVSDMAIDINRRVKLKMTCKDTMVNDRVHTGKRRITGGWRPVYNTEQFVRQRKEDTEKLRAAINNYASLKFA